MHSNTTELTKARIATIHEIYRPGMSSKDIAGRLSAREGQTVTKNMVIGIYKRNGEYLHACPLPPPGNATTNRVSTRRVRLAKPKARTKPAIVPPRPIAGPSNVVRFVLPETAFTYVATHPTKRLIDLRADECRWPMNGSGAETQFCSQEADGSYCEHHRLMSVGEGSRGERNAVKTLKRYG